MNNFEYTRNCFRSLIECYFFLLLLMEYLEIKAITPSNSPLY